MTLAEYREDKKDLMKSILRAINDKRAGVQQVVTKSGSLITNDSDKTDGLYSQK